MQLQTMDAEAWLEERTRMEVRIKKLTSELAKLREHVYRTGSPKKVGVYACRAPLDNIHDSATLYEDHFLMWFEGEWYYLDSDQKFRGEVYGWVGPLPRVPKYVLPHWRKTLRNKSRVCDSGV